MKRTTGLQLLLAVFLLPGLSLNGLAEEEGEAKPARLFESQDTLKVRLTAPWRTIERKPSIQDPYAATIEWTDEMGNSYTRELTVQRRGLTRQQVCRYPPIKLRFEKENVKGTTFRGQKSLKMVTHCDKGNRFEQYYVLEMLAYQMFNLITEFSFRVRPLEIIYVDSANDSEQEPRFAFLIEDDSDVAKRNGQKKLRVAETFPSRLETQQASNFALFQYMIGNLDWSPLSGPDPKECCHNAKLAGLDPEVDPVYPLLYDLDSSGLVDAHYAAPPAGIPVNSVTQRVYRGFCVHNASLEDAKARFLAQRQAIDALLENESRLTDRSRKKARKFLNGFWETILDPKDWQKLIIGKCRK
jgi:hypothetical protein